ncbi:unnamed protein product [Acanthocheilonema viteae]|uniref:Uncharacterized protein n=1 Tax=Acanthocheilonema viteae TaxID=6277 RepID=A0A498SFE9_ACAVI|nr:unnamed protein product [Acanthocheilonema viteae]
MIGFSQPGTEIGINLTLGTAVSTQTKVVCNSKIPQPAELGAKSNLSLMLKEEEQGEEVLALPSPGTLNDMMSKVQIRGKQLSDLLGKRGALTEMEYLKEGVCVSVFVFGIGERSVCRCPLL